MTAKLLGTVLLMLLLSLTSIAEAFSPHPDCTFNKIEPLPEVENCDDLDRRIKKIKSNMASAQRAMDALRRDHADAITDLWIQGMEVVVGEVTDMPTSAADCVGAAISYCSQRIGAAYSAVTNLIGASSTFAGGLRARQKWSEWREELSKLERNLEAAEEELAECEARTLAQAKVRDDADAYNRAGLPKYPADHPLCKPPEDPKPNPAKDHKEDAPGIGAGSSSERPGGDPSHSHTDEGHRSAVGSTESGGSVLTPQWSRINEFSRDEVQNALDWMESELAVCSGLSSGRRACVNRTLNKRTQVTREIDKGRNNAASAGAQAQWEDMRTQVDELRVRGNEIKNN
ncbi:MAG: hypothetical protein AAGI88_11550 [Pseudomonadota bacterium]